MNNAAALGAPALALVFALVTGCTVGGTSSAGAENDRLRKENRDLREQVALLTAQRDEALSKLAGGAGVAASSRVAGIEIGRFSGFAPADAARPATAVLAYIQPYDGERRFTQVSGELTVTATLAPGPGVTGEAVEIASRTLSPGEVRAAYRSGLTGTHYTVELPLTPALERRAGTLTIRAEFRDAESGVAHKAARDVTIP